jgi:hypothetical protein
MEWIEKRELKLKSIREKLHPQFLLRFDQLMNELSPQWCPYQGIRTMQQQQQLYLQGRGTPGLKVTNAKAGESPHNWGCAVDLTIWTATGHPIWSHASWGELEDKCQKFALEWGGWWVSFPDRFHIELPLRIKWKDIGDTCRLYGEAVALQKIKENYI